MKPEDLKRNYLGVNRGVSTDMSADETGETREYVMECVGRFYAGDFGEIPPEDTAANLAELEAGEGRALARYKARFALENDIYINAYFSASNAGDIEYNNTVVMYVNEY